MVFLVFFVHLSLKKGNTNYHKNGGSLTPRHHKNLFSWFNNKSIETMPLVDKFACDKRTIDVYSKFEKAFGSVTSGNLVTTVIGKLFSAEIFLIKR